MLIGLVAAIAAVVAAVGVWRDRPEPRPVAAVSLAAVSSDPQAGQPVAQAAASLRPVKTTTGPGSASTGATQAASRLVVSVTGKVLRPGVVTVPAGSRVSDAIAAAGGATKAADITGLNLAARLTDGESIIVPAAGQVGAPVGDMAAPAVAPNSAAASTAARTPLDLNTATAGALDTLPGVGPVTAGDIVSWRQQHGLFTSVDQLQEIPGIGPAKFAHLAPLVTVR